MYLTQLKMITPRFKPKKKKCKICGIPFVPYNSLTKVCEKSDCRSALALKLLVKQKEKEWKRRKKKMIENLMTVSDWVKKVQKEVNKQVRERDEGKSCITCSTILNSSVKKFDAGHWYSVNHSSVRFDLDNIHGQCVKCNRWLNSNPHIYAMNIVQRIGQENVDRLKGEAYKYKGWSVDVLKKLKEKKK